MRKVKVQFWEKQIVWNLREAVLTTELTNEEITALQMEQLDLMDADKIDWGDIHDIIYDDVIAIDDIAIIKVE